MNQALKQEFTEHCKQLNETNNSRDKEMDHSGLDDMLLELIGDEEVAKAFYSVDKWFA